MKLLQDSFTLKLKLIWLQLLIFAPGGNFYPDKYFLHQNCIEKAKETNFKLAHLQHLVGIPATKTGCHHNLAYLVKTSQCPWNQKLVYLTHKCLNLYLVVVPPPVDQQGTHHLAAQSDVTKCT